MIFTKRSQIYSCIYIYHYTVYNSRNLLHSSGPVRVSLYPRPLMVRLTSMGLNVKNFVTCTRTHAQLKANMFYTQLPLHDEVVNYSINQHNRDGVVDKFRSKKLILLKINNIPFMFVRYQF